MQTEKISGVYPLLNGDVVLINAVAEPAYDAGPYGLEFSGSAQYIDEVQLKTLTGQLVDITYLVVEFGLDETLIQYCS